MGQARTGWRWYQWPVFALMLPAGIGSGAVCRAQFGREAQTRIAVLGPLAPFTDGQDAEAVTAALRKAGYGVSILSAVQITDVNSFNANAYHVLILPHADVFPAQAQGNLLAFLKAKGRLLCLGGPAFTRYVYFNGRAWMTRQDLLNTLPTKPLLDPGAADLNAWTRAGNDPNSRATISREESPFGPALHFQFDRFTEWDNFGPPPFDQSPFAPGATLTSFRAKGDAGTSALVMEWKEQDGSRWIAPVPLTTEWRKITLTPADFHYWNDNAAKGRGGPGDRFHPEAARFWRIGLAQSHAAMAQGAHQFWIADPGSAVSPPDLPLVTAPVLEGLSPLYKQVHDVAADLWLPVLRDRGIGSVGDRPGRLLPVDLSAPAYPTANSAYSRWVYLCLSGQMQGARWGGVADLGRQGDRLTTDLTPTLHRLLQDVYLTCAGAERVTYDEGEKFQPQGHVINVAPRPLSVYAMESVVEVHRPDSKLAVSIQADGPLTLAPGMVQSIQLFPTPLALKSGEYRYQIELYTQKGGALLDRIEEPIRVVAAHPDPTRPEDRVQVTGGEFRLHGKPWRPVGINFWPLTIAGQDPQRYQRGWLSEDQYDPDLIEQDLTRCEALGVNLLSVQYTREDEAPALIDFMARCRNHHLLVNVFVANADPRDLKPDALDGLLDAARLTDNPDLFAFDVAWEPHLGAYAERRRWDASWRQWVQTQYGSLANAETDWNFSAPRAEGELTGPDDSQVTTDGPWRSMVAAYRRFLDDLLSRGYRATVQVLRRRGALVGARSGYGGNGFPGVDAQMPFDLLAGAAHLDFISPEGYALSGDWQEFRGGGFTTAYARWAGGGKPVFWAEFGRNVYPDTDADKIAVQTDTYDKVYRLILDSGANGSSAWWFPGGLRVDENSDYGIFNPDGTPRPAAKRLQQHAQTELPTATVDPTPDVWIDGDRDADARGYSALYQKGREAYARLRAAGKIPGFRTSGSATTTSTMPLLAVGNTPANGHNPLKYANAEICVDPGSPLLVVLSNTGEAVWEPAGAGRVELTVSDGKKSWRLPIPARTPRYGQVTLPVAEIRSKAAAGAKLTLRLAVVGRAEAPGGNEALPFGEELRNF